MSLNSTVLLWMRGLLLGDGLSQLSYTPIFGSLPDSLCIITTKHEFVKGVFVFLCLFLQKSQKVSVCKCGVGIGTV